MALMGAATRSLAIAVVALALLPAVALGATVGSDTGTGVLTIVDDLAAADAITVTRTPTLDVVSHDGGTLTLSGDPGDCQPAPGDTIACPVSTSIAVDLGAGNDRFSAVAIPDPISVAGGPGNDDIGTSGGPDVLAGGPGDDVLRGNSGIDEYFGES